MCFCRAKSTELATAKDKSRAKGITYAEDFESAQSLQPSSGDNKLDLRRFSAASKMFHASVISSDFDDSGKFDSSDADQVFTSSGKIHWSKMRQVMTKSVSEDKTEKDKERELKIKEASKKNALKPDAVTSRGWRAGAKPSRRLSERFLHAGEASPPVGAYPLPGATPPLGASKHELVSPSGASTPKTLLDIPESSVTVQEGQGQTSPSRSQRPQTARARLSGETGGGQGQGHGGRPGQVPRLQWRPQSASSSSSAPGVAAHRPLSARQSRPGSARTGNRSRPLSARTDNSSRPLSARTDDSGAPLHYPKPPGMSREEHEEFERGMASSRLTHRPMSARSSSGSRTVRESYDFRDSVRCPPSCSFQMLSSPGNWNSIQFDSRIHLLEHDSIQFDSRIHFKHIVKHLLADQL